MPKTENLTIYEITKYWLLTSAINFPRRLAYFFPAVHGLALNMVEVPGCRPEEYATALLDLFDSGMIELTSKLPEDDTTNRTGVSNVLDRFLKFSRENPDARLIRSAGEVRAFGPRLDRLDLKADFKLTHFGGDSWEEIAEPAWDRFFDQQSDYETGELYSQNLSILMARLGWFSELTDTRIDINTIELQTHPEFQVLYWKKLPNVYRATFSLERAEPRWTNGGVGEPKWFREWWHSTNCWYKEPWELPDWPFRNLESPRHAS